MYNKVEPRQEVYVSTLEYQTRDKITKQFFFEVNEVYSTAHNNIYYSEVTHLLTYLKFDMRLTANICLLHSLTKDA